MSILSEKTQCHSNCLSNVLLAFVSQIALLVMHYSKSLLIWFLICTIKKVATFSRLSFSEKGRKWERLLQANKSKMKRKFQFQFQISFLQPDTNLCLLMQFSVWVLSLQNSFLQNGVPPTVSRRITLDVICKSSFSSEEAFRLRKYFTFFILFVIICDIKRWSSYYMLKEDVPKIFRFRVFLWSFNDYCGAVFAAHRIFEKKNI